MRLIYLENPVECFRPSEALKYRLEHTASPSGSVKVCRSETDFLLTLPQATEVVVWEFRQEWFELAPQLRHIYTPAAGRDYFRVTLPPQVSLHYGSFHGAIMGETALGAVLAMAHGLLPFATAMKGTANPLWPRSVMVPSARRIHGSTVLILGFGSIGRSFARMAQPLGVKIIGVTRTPHSELAAEFPTIELHTIRDLESLLPQADHIVCFMPSGEATDNILNTRTLALAKKSAYIYNFGRGNCIDETALAHALQIGALAGAVLDVFATEPLPCNSALRTAPNCYLYPHASAFSPDYLDLYFASIGPSPNASLAR